MINVWLLERLGSLSRRLPPSRAKNRAGRLLAYLLGNPPLARAQVGGLWFWLRPADRTASSAFWSGGYEDWLVRFLADLLLPGMTMVDAGANVGLIGVRLAAARRRRGDGQVLCVEPVPANLTALRASIALNGLAHCCTAVETALGDAAGVATLLAEGGRKRSGNAAMVPIPERRHMARLVPTPAAVRTLDELLRERPVTGIDVMKLDVEGAELAVLRGAIHAIEEFHPAIYGEFHPDLMQVFGTSFLDVADLLAPLGYRTFVPVGWRHLREVEPATRTRGVVLATARRLQSHDPAWRIDPLA